MCGLKGGEGVEEVEGEGKEETEGEGKEETEGEGEGEIEGEGEGYVLNNEQRQTCLQEVKTEEVSPPVLAREALTDIDGCLLLVPRQHPNLNVGCLQSSNALRNFLRRERRSEGRRKGRRERERERGEEEGDKHS